MFDRFGGIGLVVILVVLVWVNMCLIFGKCVFSVFLIVFCILIDCDRFVLGICSVDMVRLFLLRFGMNLLLSCVVRLSVISMIVFVLIIMCVGCVMNVVSIGLYVCCV